MGITAAYGTRFHVELWITVDFKVSHETILILKK